MSISSSSLATGLAALLVAGLLTACGAPDSETPNPEGGAVTVPDQNETTAPSDSGTAPPEGPEESDDGAEAVKPEVEGISMDEAAKIAVDEFGGEIDGIGSDYFEGIPVWEIELEDTDLGTDLEVLVDKETGEIVHHEED